MRNCPEKVYLLVFTVWTICCSSVHAQNFPVGLPEIKNYTSKDYQWHPKNFQIVQGNNDLIYIGNSYGILEFDGKMWRKILLPNGLDGHTLNVDRKGNICIGAFNEFGQLVHKNTGDSYYESLVDFEESIGEVTGIWTSDFETIVATQTAIYQYKDHSLDLLFNIPKGLTFVEVKNRSLYYQSDKVLTVFDLGNRQVNKQLRQEQIVIGIIRNYIITQNGDFISLSSGSKESANSLPPEFEISKVVGLQSHHIALASQNQGLVILDENLKFLHHINSQHGLLSDNIFDLHEDREGNLWLALDNGISYIILNTPFTHYGISNGIRGMGYASAVHDSRLYLGTSQGVFVHKSQSEFEPLKGTEGQVYEFKSMDDQLFIAHEEGLFVLENGSLELIFDQYKVWTIKTVPNQKGLLLIGTEHGLYMIEPDSKKVNLLETFDESSRVVAFDGDQHLWVCHGNKGLFRMSLDFEKMKVQNIEFYSEKDGNLPTYISFVSQSKKGLLFSGENGIYQFDPSNKTFQLNQEISSFLKHNFYVDKIVEGTFQSLWIIQDNKITKLDPLDNGSYTLLPENIITELNGNLVGSYEYLHVYDSNNVVIGTQEGFAHFNVNANINYRINNQNNKKQTLIREVKFEQTDSSWLAPTKASPSLSLSHNFNNVTFTYASGYYQSREQIKFSFYLENKNDKSQPNWSDWHESNQNSFKNLVPGKYVFHVRSRGDLFKYSEHSSYPFIIQSPWYATRLSGILYTLIIIFIGVLIYKVRVAKIKQEKQEALLKKDEELEQQKLLAETEKIKLINDRLKEKVLLKNKELGSVALEITKKNEFLSQLKKGLTQIASSVTKDAEQKIKRSIRSIDQNMRSDNNWERFEMYFDESHQDFIKKLKEKQPDLTKSSINLCAFIKLDLSTKEIASLMNISVSGVEKRRYRLRKKLNLNSDTNLQAFLESI
ncbi:MAG: two-component regulator propeller domain-containing protein [Reichenbachiella sp.]|uniref:ligand-binding sensor domain-containing protein n=1 Tax=Reichenbachiella sp. TaxID=2184521 RepID=UPI00296752F5|nr:two-component regulator propeller domain-containing protein [Reichenbachiella sp.]MDW3209420.1 two-component regulator propeller domain-containing protein [Reichenbachiella sp.]